MLQKLRQILAIIGIVLLVGLYGLTLFAAIFEPDNTMNYLLGAVAATIMIPVVLWLLNLMIKSVSKDKNNEE